LIKELQGIGCEPETIAQCQEYLADRRKPAGSVKQRWYPLVDHSFFREKLADLHLNEDTLHVDKNVHSRLRAAVQEFRIWKWGLPETSQVEAAICEENAEAPANESATPGSQLQVDSGPAASTHSSEAAVARSLEREENIKIQEPVAEVLASQSEEKGFTEVTSEDATTKPCPSAGPAAGAPPIQKIRKKDGSCFRGVARCVTCRLC